MKESSMPLTLLQPLIA
jgi:hypothetical protein